MRPTRMGTRLNLGSARWSRGSWISSECSPCFGAHHAADHRAAPQPRHGLAVHRHQAKRRLEVGHIGNRGATQGIVVRDGQQHHTADVLSAQELVVRRRGLARKAIARVRRDQRDDLAVDLGRLGLAKKPVDLGGQVGPCSPSTRNRPSGPAGCGGSRPPPGQAPVLRRPAATQAHAQRAAARISSGSRRNRRRERSSEKPHTSSQSPHRPQSLPCPAPLSTCRARQALKPEAKKASPWPR